MNALVAMMNQPLSLENQLKRKIFYKL